MFKVIREKSKQNILVTAPEYEMVKSVADLQKMRKKCEKVSVRASVGVQALTSVSFNRRRRTGHGNIAFICFLCLV